MSEINTSRRHVLDDIGFVRVVDHMGGDNAVVQAARVSLGMGIKTPEEDRKLINYLWKNKHGTPFEHALIKFHVKAPIAIARQWFRHRIGSYNETDRPTKDEDLDFGGGQGIIEYSGNSINEISQRYTDMGDMEFYIPTNLTANVGRQETTEADLPENMRGFLTSVMRSTMEASVDIYNKLLTQGISKEQARLVLPMSLYTEFYWTVNARALINWIELRDHSHAQYEIREYATEIKTIFTEIMPWTATAFENSRS